jgi:hypothetical protein
MGPALHAEEMAGYGLLAGHIELLNLTVTDC